MRRIPRPGPRARALLLGAGAVLGLTLGAAAGPETLLRVRGPAPRVRAVSVTGQQRLTPAEVVATAALEAGVPLTRAALEAARTRLLEHPWIAAARVAGLPPHRVLVSIEERRPVARAALGDALVFVDAAGAPFAAAQADDPEPLLVGVEAAEPGRPHPVLAQGVAILAALEARHLPQAGRVVLGGDPPAALPAFEPAGDGARLVLGAGHLDEKLDRLVQLRAAGLPEVDAASEIDLRFGDEVVLRSDPAEDGSGKAGTRGGAASP